MRRVRKREPIYYTKHIRFRPFFSNRGKKNTRKPCGVSTYESHKNGEKIFHVDSMFDSSQSNISFRIKKSINFFLSSRKPF